MPERASAEPRLYHQITWLREFGHERPHVRAAQWTHAPDKQDLDMIQALTEPGRHAGESLTVWPTVSWSGGGVELGSWVLKDEQGNVFVMADAHFRDRYEPCCGTRGCQGPK